MIMKFCLSMGMVARQVMIDAIKINNPKKNFFDPENAKSTLMQMIIIKASHKTPETVCYPI